MEDKFDAIIIGAGLAGSAAAYRMAQEGLSVLVIERGPYPGAKNLSGGVLYGQALNRLIPEFWKQAPVERYITREVVSFMTGATAFNLDFKTQSFGEAPYNGFSVLRGKFDRWLAEQAETAGAMLVPGIKVEALVKDGERVTGIVAGEEQMLADVVIAADGANSFIAEQAGLRGRFNPAHLAVGVKELIGLPRETLEDRFGLSGDEGTAYGIVGFATRGVAGGGFLYTNTDTISIGVVMHLDECVHTQVKPAEVMDDFLAHPSIAPLVRGGKLLEYGAHLVPEGGIPMMPRLVTDGLLVAGDAAGLSVNNGFVVRGMDLAIGSGVAAAEAVLEAKAKSDFSAAGLAGYTQKMDASFVMQDMRTYAKAPEFMNNHRLYTAYPQMLADIMTQIYTQDSTAKQHLMPILMQGLKDSHLSLIDLGLDGWKGVRNL
ncbi:MAG TPA: FAD-dependent oxidoreductase [Anaerolineaceae bacterium]|jgi:electron transfer flavoprotein-quinone oxidoreductase